MPATAAGTVRDRRSLICLLGADFISQTGNKMLHLAIPWFVLQTTGSVAKTGLTGFFSLLPVVLAGFFGGPLIDRIGLKRTSILSDLASAAAVAAIPLLHATIGLEFSLLLALVFLGALLDSPGTTARMSLLPHVADRAQTTIDRAASLHDAMSRASSLAGPPIAGLLIAAVGAQNVLWVDAATFLVSAVLVSTGVRRDRAAGEKEGGAPYLHSLREGVTFVLRDRLLLVVILTVTVTNILDAIISFVLLPAYFERIVDSAVGFGLTVGAFGAGALAGALLYGAMGHRFSRRWVFIGAFLIVSVRAFPYLTVPGVGALLGWMLVSGLGSGPLNPILAAAEFARTPAHMRGRVVGAIMAIAWGAMPLGALAGGYLVEAIGILPSLAAVGSIYVAAALSLIFNPGVRELDRIPDTPSQ
ncbi:MAG: MFS transporter [Actinomycetota bacterium]|nr:MFS transporter [Actinomycetota bacterium]